MERVTSAHIWALRMICGLSVRAMAQRIGVDHMHVWRLEQRDENEPLPPRGAERIRGIGPDLLGSRWYAITEDYLEHHPVPPAGRRQEPGAIAQRQMRAHLARAARNANEIGLERLF